VHRVRRAVVGTWHSTEHESRRNAPRQRKVRAIHQDAKYKEVYVKEYESVSDARRSIGQFIEIVYNQKRYTRLLATSRRQSLRRRSSDNLLH
jgi:hypothetical protein